MPTEIHEISYLVEYKALTRMHGFKAGPFVGNDYKSLENRIILKGFNVCRNYLYINRL